MKADARVWIEIVSGVEGASLYVSDKDGSGRRVAGPKPWGGGNTIYRFETTASRLREAISAALPGEAA